MSEKEFPKYNYKITLFDKNDNLITDHDCNEKIKEGISVLSYNTTIKSEMFLSIKANNYVFNVNHFCIDTDNKILEILLKEVK